MSNEKAYEQDKKPQTVDKKISQQLNCLEYKSIDLDMNRKYDNTVSKYHTKTH